MNALTNLLIPKLLCNIPILRNPRLVPATLLPLLNPHPFNTIKTVLPGIRKMSSTSFSDSAVVLAKSSPLRPFIFRQLFDRESCTYTYMLADPDTREGILIDPVFELAERDAQLVKELGINLKHVMNTHVHADHVTGTGRLKLMMGNSTTSIISADSGAEADDRVHDEELVEFGKYALEVRSTPGHTNGCVCYVFHEGRMVFTGDTLLIRGCGRTDFQEGNSEVLYNSVHGKLFTLPENYLVYPAHDYKGMFCSSIGEEKKYNPRLTKTLDEFKTIMSGLNLPYPKMLDKAVPANKVCGLYNLPDDFQDKLAALSGN